MTANRLLIALSSFLALVVIGAFTWTLTYDDPHKARTDAASTPTEPDATALAPSGTSEPAMPSTEPPTTDLFGNRLEVPARSAGVVVAQTPAARPDPAGTDYLIAAPTGLRWQRIWGGAAVPISSSDGPTQITDGIATGFSRTPQGAALAAADALARALAAPEETWQQVVADRFYGGGQPLLDRFARSRASTPEAARYVTVPDGVRIRTGYQPDLAVVEFALEGRDGYSVSTWPMVWIDGDWRVRIDNIETLWEPATPVYTLTGFGSWKESR
ncbi:hypothetical protein [Nocardia rhamnosiphila]|uniref:DUF8175 domain-containing protein n=1 Tax=Nocardia rhamnosiphila TaxID=426716 RepID=A0ABV2WIW1_9NOCA